MSPFGGINGLYGDNMTPIADHLPSTQLLVLVWTEHFFGKNYLDSKRIVNPNGPEIELSFTTDRQRLDEVDAVWFHGPSITDLPPVKRQPWVLMSMESDVNYPSLNNPMVKLRFDHLMTYRLDADIPCVYPNYHHYGTFLDAPQVHSGPASGALAVYIASNPVVHRDDYVAELMNHLPIDSLGSCLNNATIDQFVTGGWSDGAWQSLLSVLPQYKFYLALENSITTDYVTERVFHALVRGVVPVYLGAANVVDFMPAEDAIINISDFDSPRDLADYLHQLDRDDAAYGKHLRWKQTELSPQFNQLLELGSSDPQARMAVKLAHGCDHNCCCGGRLRQPGVLP